MNPVTKWLSQYNITTHSIAAALATIYGAYLAVPQFHDFLNQIAASLPAKLSAGIAVGIALWLHYRQDDGQTTPIPQAGVRPGSGGFARFGALALMLLTGLVILGLIQIGCAHNNNSTAPAAPLPAGFVNQYDADTYNGLATAYVAITQSKSTFAGNAQAKAPLNAAIKAYNDARAGYLTWHTAALVTASAPHSALDNLLSIMLGAIAAVNQQFGVPPAQPQSLVRWIYFEPAHVAELEGL